MIGEIMETLNNYFIYACEDVTVTIAASTKTITIDSDSYGIDYLPSQYIRLKGTVLNDGVYKVVSKTDTVITVEEALINEANVEVSIASLSPSKPFLELVSDIETWQTSNGAYNGVSSISLGDLSKSFGSNNSWQTAFKSQLDTYRKLRW